MELKEYVRALKTECSNRKDCTGCRLENFCECVLMDADLDAVEKAAYDVLNPKTLADKLADTVTQFMIDNGVDVDDIDKMRIYPLGCRHIYCNQKSCSDCKYEGFWEREAKHD